MKKSKIINLVLITASLSSCSSFVPSWQSTPPPNENVVSRQDTINQPYWGYDNYYWRLDYRYWCHPFYYRGYCRLPAQVRNYGPRHPVGSNVRHHEAIARGGFGSTAHSGGGHSASA